MNIYEKLTEARAAIASNGMKKTGKNSFAGYSYFQLDEILPAVTKAAKDLKFLTVFNFGEHSATLDVVDAEKPEDKVTFSFTFSPNGATLKGCHPVQNDGAVQTYIKRYLYLNAFDIAECDALDDSTGDPSRAPEKPQARQQKPAPQRQQPAQQRQQPQQQAQEPQPSPEEKKKISMARFQTWAEDQKARVGEAHYNITLNRFGGVEKVFSDVATKKQFIKDVESLPDAPKQATHGNPAQNEMPLQ